MDELGYRSCHDYDVTRNTTTFVYKKKSLKNHDKYLKSTSTIDHKQSHKDQNDYKDYNYEKKDQNYKTHIVLIPRWNDPLAALFCRSLKNLNDQGASVMTINGGASTSREAVSTEVLSAAAVAADVVLTAADVSCLGCLGGGPGGLGGGTGPNSFADGPPGLPSLGANGNCNNRTSNNVKPQEDFSVGNR